MKKSINIGILALLLVTKKNIMELGNRILELRKQRKLSQTDLGKLIDIHKNVVGQYERGVVMPSIDVVIRIADVFGVSIDYLVGLTSAKIDKELLSKLEAIQSMPEKDRECIMYSINGLIQHAKTRQAYSM